MAKTDETRAIESSLRSYSPVEIGGIKRNPFRSTFTAFEVPVLRGTNQGGIIDAVKVTEYFGDIKDIRLCRCYMWRREGVRFPQMNCLNGIPDNEKPPRLCENTKCYWNTAGQEGTQKILIVCYEIKVTASDFRSKHGHNFVGNLNYYVIPSTIYQSVKDEIPEGIGVILYIKTDKYIGLRKAKDGIFSEMTDEDQKWMLLNVMNRNAEAFAGATDE